MSDVDYYQPEMPQFNPVTDQPFQQSEETFENHSSHVINEER